MIQAKQNQNGLAYLRHDRAGELALEPGDVVLDGDRILGFEPDASAELTVDVRGRSRRAEVVPKPIYEREE